MKSKRTDLLATILAGGIVSMLVVVLLAVSYSIAGWVLRLAWNAVVPSIFHGPTITFWQSVAIVGILGMVGWALRKGG